MVYIFHLSGILPNMTYLEINLVSITMEAPFLISKEKTRSLTEACVHMLITKLSLEGSLKDLR